MTTLKTCVLFALLVASQAPMAALAGQSTEDGSEEVAALRQEVATLRAELRKMQQSLDILRCQVAPENPPSDRCAALVQAMVPKGGGCQARLKELQTRKDQLSGLGLMPSHPDMRHIDSMIADVKRFCAAGK